MTRLGRSLIVTGLFIAGIASGVAAAGFVLKLAGVI